MNPDNQTIWKLWRVYGNVSYYVNQYGGVKSFRKGKWHIIRPSKHTQENFERRKAYGHGGFGPCVYHNFNFPHYGINALGHRIVASLFCQPRDLFCTQIDHLDNNPHNNRADNLEWVTGKENCQRREDLNRFKQANPTKWAQIQFINQNKFYYYA